MCESLVKNLWRSGFRDLTCDCWPVKQTIWEAHSRIWRDIDRLDFTSDSWLRPSREWPMKLTACCFLECDLILYINSHLFLCQKTLQPSISKKRKSWKNLALKTSLTRKRWSKMYSKCMMPKLNAYSLKKFEKFHGIVAQKLGCIDKKVWKMEAKWNSFNLYKHFSEGSYMFISTSEIGHLTSCYLYMTWLNWSLKLHTRLWTRH